MCGACKHCAEVLGLTCGGSPVPTGVPADTGWRPDATQHYANCLMHAVRSHFAGIWWGYVLGLFTQCLMLFVFVIKLNWVEEAHKVSPCFCPHVAEPGTQKCAWFPKQGSWLYLCERHKRGDIVERFLCSPRRPARSHFTPGVKPVFSPWLFYRLLIQPKNILAVGFCC